MNIGKALKLCRAARELSLEVIAERAGISVSYLSRLENDKREPTVTLISKLAAALGVPVPIVIYLASDDDELTGLDKETAQRFAELALNLLRSK